MTNQYTYTMLKNCKMNWETEHHTFTFITGDSRLEALDSLGDLIGSLKRLKLKILEDDCKPDDEMPRSYKVHGGCMHTTITAEIEI